MGDDSGRVTVLGAGSWGTALAIHMARRGHETLLWARSPEHVAAMAADRRNKRYLPDAPFPERLSPTSDAAQALARPDLVVCAIPSHAMRGAMRQMASVLAGRPTVSPPLYLVAAKGIEVETLANMHDVLHDESWCQ